MGVSPPSFQDMILRMKRGLSMHSFISRFHKLALAFNFCTMSWSNVPYKLCSHLILFNILEHGLSYLHVMPSKNRIQTKLKWTREKRWLKVSILYRWNWLNEVLKIKNVALNCICRIQQLSALPEQAKTSFFFFIFNKLGRRSTPCCHKDC